MNFFRKTIPAYIFAVLLVSLPGQSRQSFAETSLMHTPGVGQKHIDLDIVNMDVEIVLKIISDTSGWTIIPSQKIRGKVSLWSR